MQIFTQYDVSLLRGNLLKAFLALYLFIVPKDANSQSITFIELMKFCSEKDTINVDSILLSKGFLLQLIRGNDCDERVYINNQNPLEKCYLQKKAIFFETNNKNAYINWHYLDVSTSNLVSISEYSQKSGTFSLYHFTNRRTYKSNNYFLQTGIYIDDNYHRIITLYLYDEKSCYYNLKKDFNIPKPRQ